MVAGRPSPAPLGPVYPAGLALGGGWGLLWPYGSRVVGWCLHAVVFLAPNGYLGPEIALYPTCLHVAGSQALYKALGQPRAGNEKKKGLVQTVRGARLSSNREEKQLAL